MKQEVILVLDCGATNVRAIAEGTARRFIRMRKVTPAMSNQYPRMANQLTNV